MCEQASKFLTIWQSRSSSGIRGGRSALARRVSICQRSCNWLQTKCVQTMHVSGGRWVIGATWKRGMAEMKEMRARTFFPPRLSFVSVPFFIVCASRSTKRNLIIINREKRREMLWNGAGWGLGANAKVRENVRMRSKVHIENPIMTANRTCYKTHAHAAHLSSAVNSPLSCSQNERPRSRAPSESN
jgi:hypothetical protein